VGIRTVEYRTSQSNLGAFIEGRIVAFLLYMTVQFIEIEAVEFGTILKEFMC